MGDPSRGCLHFFEKNGAAKRELNTISGLTSNLRIESRPGQQSDQDSGATISDLGLEESPPRRWRSKRSLPSETKPMLKVNNEGKAELLEQIGPIKKELE